MTFVSIEYILLISQDENILSILKSVGKRLGAHKIKCCEKHHQALAMLAGQKPPDLIIEDIKFIEKENFFPLLQEKNMKNSFAPVPVFALISPASKEDVEAIKNSDYIGYELAPVNESLIEQKIREIYFKSYSYDQLNALNEILEQHIANKNMKIAQQILLPILRLKPKDTTYLLHYAVILFEKENYILTEKILNFILLEEPENLKAKNILAKILLLTKRYQEGKNITL